MEVQIASSCKLYTRLTYIFIFFIATVSTTLGENSILPAGVQGTEPAGFIENNGQITDMNGDAANHVLFVSQLPHLDIFITETGITFLFKEKIPKDKSGKYQKYNWQRVDLELKNAIISRQQVKKENPCICSYKYYTAQSANEIISNNFGYLIFSNIYPGIDWELIQTENAGFKYNFIIHPYADPNQIQLNYHSALPVELNDAGEIVVKSNTGVLQEFAPVSYYQGSGEIISSSFKQNSQEINQTKFCYQLEQYDASETIIIDPELYWATYYGGNKEECFNSVTTDNSGNLILVGWTDSPNFPVLTAGTFYQGTKSANEDAMIVKFSPDEERLWATFYGGNEEDWAYSVTVDETGNIFVSGETVSSNFPVYNAGTFYQGALNGDEDVFILKFDNDGNRLWATYYGGDKKEGGFSITHDASGNIFVTGYTESTDFPKLNAGTFYQSTMAGIQDAFILKFSNTGTRLWATYYGGNLYDAGNSIASDASGNIFITGDTKSSTFPVYNSGTYYQPLMAGDTDLFILKFSNTGSRLWATYYGGSSADYGHSIITDNYDNIYLAGWTESTDLPVQDMGNYFQAANAGSYDGYLLKFENDGTRLLSSYFGGNGREDLNKWDALASDQCGNIYFVLTSFSDDMPVYDAGCSSYYDAVYDGFGDLFITRFTNDNLITWATYYGYDNEDLNACIGISQLDGNSLYMTGQYNEYDPGAAVPLVNPGGLAFYDGTHNNDDEAFISKFIPVPLSIATTNSNICACADSATATPSCGVAPYAYLWTDGQTTQTAIDLCAGTYDVIVTDADCNIDTATITIVCALPVGIVNFNARETGSHVELRWTTVSELNSDYFTISKQDEFDGFTEISKIPAHGYSTTPINYSTNDFNPSGGINYYKLTETDFDGKMSEAIITTISINGVADNLFITCTEENILQANFYAASSGEYQMYLYNLAGNELYTANWSVEKGLNTKTIDGVELSRGIYVVTLTGKNEKFVSKFIY